MTRLPTLTLSLFFALSFGNHAYARLGETYEASVKRYEAAGFTKERTTFLMSGDRSRWGYCPIYKRAGCTELTWVKPRDSEKLVEVTKIRQVFYGTWPPTNNPAPWQEVLKCIEITYFFRGEEKDFVDSAPVRWEPGERGTWQAPDEYKVWQRQLFEGSGGGRNIKFQGFENILRVRHEDTFFIDKFLKYTSGITAEEIWEILEKRKSDWDQYQRLSTGAPGVGDPPPTPHEIRVLKELYESGL